MPNTHASTRLLHGSRAGGLALSLASLALLALQGINAVSGAGIALPQGLSSAEAMADLELSLLAPSDVAPGGSLDLQAVLTNTGTITTENSVLTLTLPAALEIQSASPGFSVALSSGMPISWPLGSLAISETRALTLSARMASTQTLGSQLEIEGLVASEGEDAEALDNRDLAEIEATATGLRLEAPGSAQVVVPGQRVTQTIQLHNVSPAAAENLVLSGRLGGEAVFVTDTAALEAGMQAEHAAGDAALRWTLPRLAGPQSLHFDLVSRVPMTAAQAAVISHTFEVSATTRDDLAGGAPTLGPAFVVQRPDLFVALEGPDRLQTDQIIQYRLGYGNRADVASSATVVTLTLPEGSDVSSMRPPGRREEQALVWELGSLAPDSLDFLLVDVQLLGAKPLDRAVQASALIASAVPDKAPEDNRSSVDTRLEPGPPFRIHLESSATALPIIEGRTAITASVVDAHDNAVADGFELRFTARGGLVDPQRVNTAGGKASTQFSAGPEPLTAEVEANLGVLQDVIDIVLEPADLRLEASLLAAAGPVEAQQVTPGDPITYALSLHNDGLAQADDLVLAMALEDRVVDTEIRSSMPITREDDLAEDMIRPPTPDYRLLAWRLPAASTGSVLTLSLSSTLDDSPASTWSGFDPIFYRAAITSSSELASLEELLVTDKVDVRAADLFTAISINGGASQIRPGGQIVYDVTFGNLEQTTIVPDAVVTVTLPVSTSYNHFQALAGTPMQLDEDSAAPGSRDLVFRAQTALERNNGLRLWVDIAEEVPPESLLQGRVAVGSGIYDVDLQNDRAVEPGVWMSGVNLQVTDEVPEAVAPGETLTWTLRVRNAAQRDTARSVVLRAFPPPELELLSVNPPVNPEPDGSLRWIEEQPLLPSALRSFELRLRVPTETEPGASLELSAEAWADGRESAPSDNVLSRGLTVVPGRPARIELETDRRTLTVCRPEEEARITARVSDAQGNPVADGTVLTWSVFPGELSETESPLIGGEASVTLSPGRSAGLAQLFAQAGDVRETLEFRFEADEPAALAVSADPRIVTTDESTLITVEVFDACSNPVEDGWPIRLEAERGRWPNGRSETELESENGRISGQLFVGPEQGPLRVSAHHELVFGETLLTVEAPPRWYLYAPWVGRSARLSR